jgi:hypothetical protein
VNGGLLWGGDNDPNHYHVKTIISPITMTLKDREAQNGRGYYVLHEGTGEIIRDAMGGATEWFAQ